jgi:hypothetical protein
MVAAVDGAVAMTSPPTLADLIADPGELWAWSWCMDCHHNVTMSVAALLSRYVAETPFPDVWGGFRCSVSPCQEAPTVLPSVVIPVSELDHSMRLEDHYVSKIPGFVIY